MLLPKNLSQYLPEGSFSGVLYYAKKYGFELKITKSRKTKLGDYRPPIVKDKHRITVNGDLNVYAFLVTLIHEIAHMVTWEQYGNKVKSHGKEWKFIYSTILEYFMRQNVFEEDINVYLKKHVESPPASSCRDLELSKVLRKYDEPNNKKIVDELEEGQIFKMSKGIFKKGKRLRKRFQCLEINTKKLYLFSPIAEVDIV